LLIFIKKMVDKRVIARERSDRSNLAQITGLLRLRLAMAAPDFSIIVKNIAIFQQSHVTNLQDKNQQSRNVNTSSKA